MLRSTFIKKAVIATGSFFIARDLLAQNREPVYGHNGMRYRMDAGWGTLDAAKYPVNDCHEMVEDSRGRILLLTNETKNNVLIYDKSGKLLQTWGNQFPGAHGLSIQKAGGDDFLFITDTNRHQVYKTTLDGKVLLTIDAPLETGKYNNSEQFLPTETTVLDNGDFYVADGYGLQHILHYDEKGRLKNIFGGKGDGKEYLDNAHGITVDKRRTPHTLLVTDRTRNCFKRFSLDGRLLEEIAVPGACVCRAVIKGKNLYAAVLRSPDLGAAGSGFVTILNEDNRVVSNIGGTAPIYQNNVLQPLRQAEKILVHPHDVLVDSDDNLYVAQWASGKVYPYKFKRV